MRYTNNSEIWKKWLREMFDRNQNPLFVDGGWEIFDGLNDNSILIEDEAYQRQNEKYHNKGVNK